jgi:hypothetical protein
MKPACLLCLYVGSSVFRLCSCAHTEYMSMPSDSCVPARRFAANPWVDGEGRDGTCWLAGRLMAGSNQIDYEHVEEGARYLATNILF